MSPLGDAYRRARERRGGGGDQRREEVGPGAAPPGASGQEAAGPRDQAATSASGARSAGVRRPSVTQTFQPFSSQEGNVPDTQAMAVAGTTVDPLARASRVAGFAEGPLRPGCDELAGLRAAVYAAGLDRPPATILVTGPVGGAGTTAVAVGLAGELARDLSRQVLLVDADVRSPGVASLLEVDARYDLADVLEMRADAGEAILHSEVDNLSALVMRSDSVTGTSRITAEQLASRAANEVLSAIERAFAYVVIDAGATEESAAARVLAGRAAGVVLVLPVGVTRTRARAARATVEGAGGRVLGAVLTGASS